MKIWCDFSKNLLIIFIFSLIIHFHYPLLSKLFTTSSHLTFLNYSLSLTHSSVILYIPISCPFRQIHQCHSPINVKDLFSLLHLLSGTLCLFHFALLLPLPLFILVFLHNFLFHAVWVEQLCLGLPLRASPTLSSDSETDVKLIVLLYCIFRFQFEYKI